MNATANPTNSAGHGPLHYFLRHVVVIYLRLVKGSDQRDIFLTGFRTSNSGCGMAYELVNSNACRNWL